jgi:hypothetical protein
MSYGVLNLTHRAGHDRTAPMTPGQFVEVQLQLNDLGERVAAGHRLRLAVSTSYWPMVWPSPEPVTLRVATDRSSLTLPARPPQADDRALAAFPQPEMAPPVAFTRSRQGRRDREIHENPTTGETVFTIHRDRGAYRLHDIDLTVDGGAVERFSITEGDPLSAKGDIAWRVPFGDDPAIRNHPALKDAKLPDALGSPGAYGVIATKSGLVIGGTADSFSGNRGGPGICLWHLFVALRR